MECNILDFLKEFFSNTGFAKIGVEHFIMISVGLGALYMGVFKKLAPILLVPIGFGILIGNIPFPGIQAGTYEPVFDFFYLGMSKGIYPALIFLGLGAMIDFSVIISNPKLVLVGIAAQIGIFVAFLLAIGFGFELGEASAMSIIASADGPSSIFLASRLSSDLLSVIAISAYTYMALTPIVQPHIMRWLTKPSERVIKMPPARAVSQTEKIIFPIAGFLITCFLVPTALPLLGMLFFGNFLKECGVTKRLADTVGGSLSDIVVIMIGLTLGISTQASTFFTTQSVMIFGIGAVAFCIATASGVIFVKLMNLFLKDGQKVNPLIGNAGVSALPDAAKLSQEMGLKYDSTNHLQMHAMGPTVASIIGSALVAGLMLSFSSVL